MNYFVEIPIVFSLITAAELLVQIAVIMHILLTKHEDSTSAILWIFAVGVFPILGVLSYLLFGINRINTMGLGIKTANELIKLQQVENSGYIRKYFEKQRQFITRMESKEKGGYSFCRTLDRLMPEAPPLSGNKLELLQDGTMAYPKMLEAIENAKDHIHLQSFIIVNDGIGRKIFDALDRKASEGIDVKVIYDRFGSFPAIWSHFFKRYLIERRPNFKIHAFAKVNPMTPWRIQLRNHRKLLIVDGNLAFIGGINISSDNIQAEEKPESKYIHDLHCMMKGPAVGQLQFSFLRDWCYAAELGAVEVFKERYFPLPEAFGESEIRIIDSGPGQNYRSSEKLFFTAVSTASKYIWIMTPYFVPEISFIKAVCMAAARGVEIRLIVPKHNNHWYVKYATWSLYHNLLDNGIRIYEREGVFSHAKAMLVDGEWGVMGSSNCDVRSFKLNYELDFVVANCEFLGEIHAQFEEEFAHSDEVTLSRIYERSFRQRLAENMCSLLIPVL